MTPTTLLSVDPGRTSGWALWARGEAWELQRYGQLELSHVPVGDEVEPIRGLLSRLAVPCWAEARMVVEGQFYRPPSYRGGQRVYQSSPWKAVQRLTEIRCAWADVARLVCGCPVDVVDPGRWIPQMTTGEPGKTPDDRIRARVKRRWPRIRPSSHEAAAILLGAWWVEEQRGGISIEIEGRGER